ncbi:MAG TPA: hypothetical protein PKD90_16295, partial [Phnomibacter sp.]|nr:hypothetical protein [Phnomibacter sp.]
ALATLLVALAWYLLLAETGERMYSGNFYWQIPLSLFTVYLAATPVLYPLFCGKTTPWQAKLIAGLAAMQCLGGLAYVVRTCVSGQYM